MWFKIASRISCSLILTAVFSALVLADTIRLKDGSIIKGHIASFSGGNFILEIGDGSHRRQLTFSVDEIESITFDTRIPQVTNPSTTPASYSKPEIVQPPKPAPSPSSVQTTSQQPRRITTSSKAGPIKWNTKVAADNSSNGWTNTGWVVRRHAC